MAIVTKVKKSKKPKYKHPVAKAKGRGVGSAERFVGTKVPGSMKHLVRKAEPGDDFDHDGHGTPAKTKFKNEFYVRAYELARSGMGLRQIAEGLQVSQMTVKNWMRQDPAFAKAVNDGRLPDSKNGPKKAYVNYIYRRLPEDLKRYWNKLSRFERMKNGYRKAEIMLERAGDNVQKWLFIHALVMNHFNQSAACRKVLVNHGRLAKWKQEPEFVELMDHVYFMKKDFGEGKLMEGIAAGDPGLIRFFNSTINRDRGYDPKVTVVHEGKVQHQLTLEKVLDKLPLKDRLRMLETFDQVGREVAAGPREVQALPVHIQGDGDEQAD